MKKYCVASFSKLMTTAVSTVLLHQSETTIAVRQILAELKLFP